MKRVKMDAELIFAEDVEVCPECGGTDFYELWSGDDEDAELEGLVCKKCC